MRPTACLIALLPLAAQAEGAVQVFDCRTTNVCDGTGACAPPAGSEEGRVVIRLEPISVGTQGEGDYRIGYGEVSAPVTNVTGVGPLLWTDRPGHAQTILLTGNTSLLWQDLDLGTGTSTLSFLTCEVTQ